jgi:hypothetical protein
MSSIGLDTGPLADFLSQFFGPAQRGFALFQRSFLLSEDAVGAINAIVRAYNEDEPARALVFASTLAFAELARKWDALAGGRFHPHQLRAFLTVPPGWFVVEPVDQSLVESFLEVPVAVQMENGDLKNVEWADAIHVATAFSRDSQQVKCLLATQDHRIQRIPQLARRCV